MSKLRAWIIEDEPPALRRLTQLLQSLATPVEVVFSTDTVQASIAALANQPLPDIIFSDIHLADGNCFEIWENHPIAVPVVFTTAFDQYSIRAFKVNSIDYLLKPVEKMELEQTVAKFGRWQQQPHAPDWTAIQQLLQQPAITYRSRFLAQQGTQWLPLAVEQIREIYSEDSLTFARTKDRQRYLLDESLDRIEEGLNPSLWFRINRAQLVHIEAVQRVQTYFNNRLLLVLDPPSTIQAIVSRPRVKACREWLGGGK